MNHLSSGKKLSKPSRSVIELAIWSRSVWLRSDDYRHPINSNLIRQLASPKTLKRTFCLARVPKV